MGRERTRKANRSPATQHASAATEPGSCRLCRADPEPVVGASAQLSPQALIPRDAVGSDSGTEGWFSTWAAKTAGLHRHKRSQSLKAPFSECKPGSLGIRAAAGTGARELLTHRQPSSAPHLPEGEPTAAGLKRPAERAAPGSRAAFPEAGRGSSLPALPRPAPAPTAMEAVSPAGSGNSLATKRHVHGAVPPHSLLTKVYLV